MYSIYIFRFVLKIEKPLYMYTQGHYVFLSFIKLKCFMTNKKTAMLSLQRKYIFYVKYSYVMNEENVKKHHVILITRKVILKAISYTLIISGS